MRDVHTRPTDGEDQEVVSEELPAPPSRASSPGAAAASGAGRQRPSTPEPTDPGTDSSTLSRPHLPPCPSGSRVGNQTDLGAVTSPR